jgi:hypothetical protein
MPPRKPKPAPPKFSIPVDSVNHKDKRADIPTQELLGIGRWAFLEIVDPWDAKNTIRKFVKGEKVDGVGPLLQKNNFEGNSRCIYSTLTNADDRLWKTRLFMMIRGLSWQGSRFIRVSGF